MTVCRWPLAVTLVALGCGETTTPPEPTVATTLTVTPAEASLRAFGDTARLSAAVFDQFGNAMDGVRVTWTSLNPTIARVSEAGLVTALGNGNGSVLATSTGVTGRASVFVQQEIAALVAVQGDSQTAAVGSTVPVAPAVRIDDSNGNPIADAPVVFAVVSGGGGVVGGAVASGADGIAAVGSWTLGTTTGGNLLEASASGAVPHVFRAIGTSGPAATAIIERGDGQTAVAGSSVAVRPAVAVGDKHDNPVSGVSVSFSVVSGGGVIVGDSAISDTHGVATVGGWTLGATAGTNELQAVVGDLDPIVITAEGVAGAAASAAVFAGDNQAGKPGSPLPIPPAVQLRDAHGNGVAGDTVVFSVTAGGGSLAARIAASDSNGVAVGGVWTLGSSPGINTVIATAGALPPLTFTATGSAGPVAVSVFDGNSQRVLAGSQVIVPPSVLVTDAAGHPVSGVNVTFRVTAGSGSITGDTAATDVSGVAAVGSWTLGPLAGSNELTATVSGLTPSVISAAGVNAEYDIEVRLLDSTTVAVEAAFLNAEAMWESVIVGDVPDVDFSVAPVVAGTCGINHPQLDVAIDDLMIWVRLQAIDGPGGVLGFAGPCIVRPAPGVSSVVGIMVFDNADLDVLATNGLLGAVVLHEIGHVLGFGTLWQSYGLLKNPSLPSSPGVDTHFDGIFATSAFDQLGGTTYTGGEKVPVENTQGSAGTRDGHWRESVFAHELMTGFINSGANPLSLTSIASLADLTLVPNPAAADHFAHTFTIRAPIQTNGIELRNDLWLGPVFVVTPTTTLRRWRR